MLENPIVKSKYIYSNLHLLVLLGPDRIKSFQFVRGRLSGKIIFSFLKKTIDGLLRYRAVQDKEFVIILDNLPLNQSSSLFYFMVNKRITLLFTSPTSSFLNPVEMLFAKIKQLLKKLYCQDK